MQHIELLSCSTQPNGYADDTLLKQIGWNSQFWCSSLGKHYLDKNDKILNLLTKRGGIIVPIALNFRISEG